MSQAEGAVYSAGNDEVVGEYNSSRNPKYPLVDEREEDDDDVNDSSDDADEAHFRLTEEFNDLPWTKRPSAIVLVMTFFTFAVAQTLVIPSGFDVMIELICAAYFSDENVNSKFGSDPRCRGAEVTAKVASFASYRSVIVGVLGVLVTPRLAAVSDRIGRKPMLIWCSICGMLGDSIFFACVRYPNRIDYRGLLMASFMQGIGGSMGTVQVINTAYVSDCIPPSSRARVLGILDSCLFGALAVGPVLGSIILKALQSLDRLYMVTVGIYAVNMVMVLLTVVESRPHKARRMSQAAYEADMTDATSWQQYLHQVNLLKPISVLSFSHLKRSRERRNAKLLVAMASLGAEFAISIAPMILMYAEMKFKWTSVETGYIMSLFGVSRTAVLGLVFPVALGILRYRNAATSGRIHKTDILFVRVGQIFSCLGFLAIANAPTPPLYLCAVVFDSFAGIQIPAVKNAIIRHACPDRVGELLGALSFVNNLGMIVTPPLFYRIFNLTVYTRPQMIFEIVAGGYLLLLGLSFFLSTQETKESAEYAELLSEQSEEYGASA
jgi:hypothetical protein